MLSRMRRGSLRTVDAVEGVCITYLPSGGGEIGSFIRIAGHRGKVLASLPAAAHREDDFQVFMFSFQSGTGAETAFRPVDVDVDLVVGPIVAELCGVSTSCWLLLNSLASYIDGAVFPNPLS